MPVFGARRIRIHANDLDIVRHDLPQGVLDLLCAHPHLCQIPAPALGASGGGGGVRIDAIRGPAGVALKGMGALMIRKGRGTMAARGDATALTAHEKRSKATAVMEQDRLFTPLRNLHQGIVERAREERSAPVPELAAQVYHGHLGKPGSTGALGHLDPLPTLSHVLSRSGARKGFGARCRRPQNERASVDASHLRCDLARMVPGRRPLFVGLLVLLVDDDDAEMLEGAEQCRACAHHHAGGTGGDHVPLVKALTGRKARVKHRHGRTETRTEAPDGLRREGDLGDQNAGGAPACKDMLDGREIHLGFSRPRHAVDKNHVPPAGDSGLIDRIEGLTLAFGQAQGHRRPSRRESRFLPGPSPCPALLDAHDAAFGKGAHDGRHIGVENPQLARGHRTVRERLQQLSLPLGVNGRHVHAPLIGKFDPALSSLTDSRALDAVGPVRSANKARGRSGWQEKTQAFRDGGDVLARHPKRNLCRLFGERRLCKHIAQRFYLSGVEPGGTGKSAQLIGARDHVPQTRTVSERDQNRGPHQRLVCKPGGHRVGKCIRDGARGDIDENRHECRDRRKSGGTRASGHLLNRAIRFRKKRGLTGHQSTAMQRRTGRAAPRRGRSSPT